jgi:WD40 repeat protein
MNFLPVFRIFSVFDSSIETKILPHPTFVYATRFHPFNEKIVCTGGYDKTLRIWSIAKPAQYGQLVQELYGHIGYINSMCFSNDGHSMYSADSFGRIHCWKSYGDEISLGFGGF